MRVIIGNHNQKPVHLRVGGDGYVEYASASGYHWAVDKEWQDVQRWLIKRRIPYHRFGWRNRSDE